jgi:putative addiction module component (TIGR02574 family)
MAMSPERLEIERKAFRLPTKERELLAERLIQSVEGVPLTEVEEAWVKEAERRFKAWRRGERKGVSAKSAFRQIRKDLGW